MLTKKQKEEWIAALRSGEYEQGQNALYDPKSNRYCCIGVLIKINGLPLKPQSDWIGEYMWLQSYNHKQINLHVNEKRFSEFALFEEIFINHNQIDFGKYGQITYKKCTGIFGITITDTATGLSNLNDECDWSFLQIADLLEDHLPTKDYPN